MAVPVVATQDSAALAALRHFRSLAKDPKTFDPGLTKSAASEAEEEQNSKDREKDRELKEKTHSTVFKILIAQIIALFLLMLLQGWGPWGFGLNQWAFGIFLNGTLVQTYFLVRFIVEHLYPRKDSHKV